MSSIERLLCEFSADRWHDISNMAAERAAPERELLTRTPLDPDCGALDGRRLVNELMELLERMLERDDGRPECTVKGISGSVNERGGVCMGGW